MTTLIQGTSLHYYSERANSDKYYRVFLMLDTPVVTVVSHWGRDGAHGQTKVETFVNEQAARTAVARKVSTKTKKGYQHLGAGTVRVPWGDTYQQMSEKLHAWVGRPPVKMPDGYEFVIVEEESIEDLIAA